ncbi:MAG: hypothetical protein M1836_000741 [Candelina mexicana]|nr:MAG: hypothetical protein M1836_000741 [Candelina mexicana]
MVYTDSRSSVPVWNPREVLSIDLDTSIVLCAGWLRRKNRSCHRHINANNRTTAGELLDELGRTSPTEAAENYDKLLELASRVLCLGKYNHQHQASRIVEGWQAKIHEYEYENHEQRARDGPTNTPELSLAHSAQVFPHSLPREPQWRSYAAVAAAPLVQSRPRVPSPPHRPAAPESHSRISVDVICLVCHEGLVTTSPLQPLRTNLARLTGAITVGRYGERVESLEKYGRAPRDV